MAQTSNSENITVNESYDLSKVSSVNENLTSLSPISGRSDDHSINELIEENIEKPGDRTSTITKNQLFYIYVTLS
jgi:hypothetical protein